MNKTILLILVLFLSGLFISRHANSWGFYGHKKINKMAVFCLPPEMIGFYKKNIDYITEHAVDPDKRRYSDEEEAPRHYIDIDRYGIHPFDSIPQYWKDAVKKYTEDSLKAHGIVPWHIEKMLYQLTEAFKNENAENILFLSACIGHYIADAHVPLHTTKNYNGQLTNQKGIHGFWESRIPELKADEYDYFVGRAFYVEKPLKKAWNIVKASYLAKDSVLLFEAQLNANFPSDKKYTYENRGSAIIKAYSEEYTTEYDRMLNGMVERRMREAIITVSSFWYTAWVNAGQPNLDILSNKKIDFIEEKTPLTDSLKSGKKEIAGHAD